MDKFWEMVSERIEDLAIVKKRLARQWDTVQHILMHDIPQDLQKFFQIQAKIQQERLDRMVEFAYHNLQTEWLFVQRNILTFLQFATHFLHNRWRQLQPKLDNLVQTSFAISTATSTLQLTVQITPIVLSALTILAAAPMLNALLPDFLFNTTVIFFIMMGISAYAGYSKFKELELRAKLDGQIEINDKQSKRHSRQLRRLGHRLKELERALYPIPSFAPAAAPPPPPLVRQHRPPQVFEKKRKRPQSPQIVPNYRKAGAYKR